MATVYHVVTVFSIGRRHDESSDHVATEVEIGPWQSLSRQSVYTKTACSLSGQGIVMIYFILPFVLEVFEFLDIILQNRNIFVYVILSSLLSNTCCQLGDVHCIVSNLNIIYTLSTYKVTY